jgi:curved DNA-binding protein CbpA
METTTIQRWVNALEQLSHFQVLSVPRDASFDDIRFAFHRFARLFHPDQHFSRNEEERVHIASIFRAGTEAYRVLIDPALRARYEAQTQAQQPQGSSPSAFPSDGSYSSSSSSLRPAAALRLEDHVRSASIRPFARRAEELLASGDIAQAHLQIRLALSREPENPALIEFEKRVASQKTLRPSKSV